MESTSNIWTIVFLIFAGQGVFLSIFLFVKKSVFLKSNRFLAILFLLFSINLIENVCHWTGFILNVPHISNSTAGFVYLYGPLFYFFVLNRINTELELKWTDLFHLLPFVLISIRLMSYYLLSSEFKIYSLNHQGEFSSYQDYVFQALSVGTVIIYGLLSKNIYTKSVYDSMLLKSALYSFLAFGITYAIYFIVINVTQTGLFFDFIVTLTLCFLIYLMGYYALIYPNFFDPTFHKKKSDIKYLKSNLSEVDSQNYLIEIKTLMNEEKLYLNRNLKARDLAERIGASTNYISQALNQHAQMSFIEYINKHRVEEAKKLMKEEKFSHYTLEAIAMEAGFNNKTSFNKYFKEFTALTPKQFKNDLVK